MSFSCAYLLKINITFLYLSPLSWTFTWNINASTFNNIFLKAIGESLSIYQPTVTQLNQESERLHNSGQSIDARRIMDITTKYEILQDQVTHQRKKIHKELVLQQQCQSQSEHVESLLSECKGNLEKVDHQETGEKMKTLKVKKLLNYIFNIMEFQIHLSFQNDYTTISLSISPFYEKCLQVIYTKYIYI